MSDKIDEDIENPTERQTDRQKDRQTDRQTDRRTDGLSEVLETGPVFLSTDSLTWKQKIPDGEKYP